MNCGFVIDRAGLPMMGDAPGRFFSAVRASSARNVLALLVIVAVGPRNVDAELPPCGYEIAGLIKPPAGTSVHPVGMNNNNEVVGSIHTINSYIPFFWSVETGMLQLPLPPAGHPDAMPADINDHGVIVGTVDPTGLMRGFVLRGGVYSFVHALPGGAWCQLAEINNTDLHVGLRSLGDPRTPSQLDNFPQNAIAVSRSVVDLGIPVSFASGAHHCSEAGDVVGWSGLQQTHTLRGVLWRGGDATILPMLPDAAYAGTHCVTSALEIVGYDNYILPNGEVRGRAMIWRNLTPMSLGVLPGYKRSTATSINARGVVVGACNDTATSINAMRAFIWTQETGMLDLNWLLYGANPDHELTLGVVINDGGSILSLITGHGAGAAALLVPRQPPAADITADCHVDLEDLGILLSCWGMTDCEGDINDDGVVDLGDLGILLANWDKPPQTEPPLTYPIGDYPW